MIGRSWLRTGVPDGKRGAASYAILVSTLRTLEVRVSSPNMTGIVQHQILSANVNLHSSFTRQTPVH